MIDRADELLRKADALIMRRRSFVAGAARSPSSGADLPVLTDVVSEAPAAAPLESAPPAPVEPDAALIEALVEARLEQLLPQRVEERVAGRLEEIVPALVEQALADSLPDAVEAALPQRLAQLLPQRVEEALPARLAAVLPDEVEKALQTRLPAALELRLAEHLAQLQPLMAEALRSWLTREVPRIIAKELDNIGARIAERLTIEFNAAILPQLDAVLLTPPRPDDAANGGR